MKKAVKIVGVLALALVLVVAVAAGWVSFKYDDMFEAKFTVAPHPVSVPTGDADLAEGKRLLLARGCADCHGDDLGGKAFIDDPVLGALYSSNLTGGKGSRMKEYSEVDLERLLRHSVRPDGTSLVYMPAEELWHLGDEEVGRMILALRALAPVDREQPPHTPSFLLKALSVLGVFKIVPAAVVDHAKAHPAAPPAGPTASFGAHLVNSCTGCHGAGLSGGRIPGTPDSIPVPTNITPAPDGLARYSESQFMNAMRTGKRPDGTDMNAFMPWKVYQHMTDDELKALYAHLQSLPARPFGGR